VILLKNIARNLRNVPWSDGLRRSLVDPNKGKQKDRMATLIRVTKSENSASKLRAAMSFECECVGKSVRSRAIRGLDRVEAKPQRTPLPKEEALRVLFSIAVTSLVV